MRRAEAVNESLPPQEKERRARWLAVPKEVRQELRRMHVNLGHISAVGLMRRLRRAGARADVIEACKYLPCDACGLAIRRLHPRPTKPPAKFQFNYLVWLDCFVAYDCEQNAYEFVNILCDGTGFGVVWCIGRAHGVPTAQNVLHAFTHTWTSWAGWPHVVRVDRGKEFMSVFADGLTNHGVELDGIPLEAPWQLGKCEKRGGLWKEVWRRVVEDTQVSGLEQVRTTSTIVSQVLNETRTSRDSRHLSGYSVLTRSGFRRIYSKTANSECSKYNKPQKIRAARWRRTFEDENRRG